MESAQPSLKLKHLRLTLSRYDAKYSKTSTVLDDDEDISDDADVVTNGPHTTPPRESRILSLHQDEYHTDVKNNSVEASQDEKNILNQTVVAEMEEQKNDETLSSKSFPFCNRDSKQNSAGSLASVETDSEIGFNNVHSFSSLAESILPLEEEVKQDSTALVIKTKSQVPTSFIAKISLSSSSEKSLKEKGKCTADVLFNTPARNTALPAGSSIKIEMETLSSSSKEEKDQNKSGRSFVLDEGAMSNKEGTESLSIFKKKLLTSSKETKIGALKSMDKSSHCNSGNAKVSIGTQTLCFEDVRTNRLNSVRSKYAATATPIIKPLQLPMYVRDDNGISHNIKGENRTVENEIEKLVSYHLDLVNEFLERQHRMYLANCKAVQLLERGYKENNLETTLKVKLDGPGSSEEGSKKVQKKGCLWNHPK